MGLPLICSGHAPIVKLGAPGDRFKCVPLDGNGVEVVGDVISPHKLLLGDFDGVRGDLSPEVMFSISQFLQSTPCCPWCSGHCRDRWNCCCCWCKNSLSNFAAAAAFVLARSCCCVDELLLLATVTAVATTDDDDVEDDGEFDDCCWLFITLLLLLVKLLFVLLLALLELSVPLLLLLLCCFDGDIDDVFDDDELLCARWLGDFSEEELLFNNIAAAD